MANNDTHRHVFRQTPTRASAVGAGRGPAPGGLREAVRGSGPRAERRPAAASCRNRTADPPRRLRRRSGPPEPEGPVDGGRTGLWPWRVALTSLVGGTFGPASRPPRPNRHLATQPIRALPPRHNHPQERHPPATRCDRERRYPLHVSRPHPPGPRRRARSTRARPRVRAGRGAASLRPQGNRRRARASQRPPRDREVA